MGHVFPRGQGWGNYGPASVKNALYSPLAQGAHEETGEIFVQLNEKSGQLMADT